MLSHDLIIYYTAAQKIGCQIKKVFINTKGAVVCSNTGKSIYLYIIKTIFYWKYILNVIYFLWSNQHHSSVFQGHMIFRNDSNMIWSRNIVYYYSMLKTAVLIFVWK